MFNKALSNYGTAIGGFRSKITSRFHTVLGGSKNTGAGRFGFSAGYRGKASADYSAVISLSSQPCEARGGGLAVCADSFTVVDSSGDSYDVVDLFDRRVRDLAEVEEMGKVIKASDSLFNSHTKRLVDHEKRLHTLDKQTSSLEKDMNRYLASLEMANSILHQQ